jgi:hypothetical protein
VSVAYVMESTSVCRVFDGEDVEALKKLLQR